MFVRAVVHPEKRCFFALLIWTVCVRRFLKLFTNFAKFAPLDLFADKITNYGVSIIPLLILLYYFYS